MSALIIQHLYTYRRYIWRNAWTDLRYSYAGTGLGVFWNVINPLLEVLIYSFVFTQLIVVHSDGEQGASFVLYLCVGLFPWLAFAETVQQGSNAFLANAAYLKRLAIPAEVFLIKSVLTSTFNLYITLLVLLLFSLATGQPWRWGWLLLPLLALLLQSLALGLALILGNLRVFFPDIGEAMRTLMQLWKWTMPIVYPEMLLPEAVRAWLPLNPPYVFIQSIRNLFLDGRLPSSSAWFMMLIWLVIFALIGALVTQKLRPEIKDNL